MDLGPRGPASSTLQPFQSMDSGAAEHHPELATCPNGEVVMSGIESELASVDPAADHETTLVQEIVEQQLMALEVPESLERQLQLACSQHK